MGQNMALLLDTEGERLYNICIGDYPFRTDLCTEVIISEIHPGVRI